MGFSIYSCAAIATVNLEHSYHPKIDFLLEDRSVRCEESAGGDKNGGREASCEGCERCWRSVSETCCEILGKLWQQWRWEQNGANSLTSGCRCRCGWLGGW